jgi:hypothetical protein
LADPDSGNINVHDFSIRQLEKDVTEGLETLEDNNPIEDGDVCFSIRNLT